MSGLSETGNLIPREELAAALLDQLGDIRQKLDIFTIDLNRELFGNRELVDILRLWIINCPRAQIRIFVKDAQRSMMRGNPLIELGLNLTSYFQFREPTPQQNIDLDEMILIDQRHAFTWSERQPEIKFIQDQSLQLAPLQSGFDECWHRGQASQHIRNLNL